MVKTQQLIDRLNAAETQGRAKTFDRLWAKLVKQGVTLHWIEKAERYELDTTKTAEKSPLPDWLDAILADADAHLTWKPPAPETIDLELQ